MSDELVKRLREDQPVTQDMVSTMQCALQDAAADRIEELEANLAKAVEVMREAIRLSEQPHYGDRGDALDHCFDAIDVLRTTLAELTGEK